MDCIVIDVLENIRQRPSMYSRSPPTDRFGQIRELEMIVAGYKTAVFEHEIQEPVRDFSGDFAAYLYRNKGWGASVGPFHAIARSTSSGEEAWELLWKLVEDFKANLSAESSQGRLSSFASKADEMIDADRHLATLLVGLSIKPHFYLLGSSLQQLVAFLGGYVRMQTLHGEPSILSGVLLDEFGAWLATEKKAQGSDWYWRVVSLDASENNVVTMLRLLAEFLVARGIGVSPQDAEDWFFGRGRWGAGALADPPQG